MTVVTQRSTTPRAQGAEATRLRSLLVLLVGLVAVLVPTGVASAHDDIAGSVPADRSTIDAPITSASIDFGADISDSVSMFLTYDPGDGAVVDLGGETTKTGAQTARIDFPELEARGTYFLQYLAPVPADGHVVVGAISFNYGAPTAIDQGDNPDVRSSTPASRARLDDPVDSAEIVFDIEVDDMELVLVRDYGDGERFEDLGGSTTVVDARRVRLDFAEPLPAEGTYFVTYDGTAVVTGDEVVGAISFTWGDPASGSSSFPVLPFLLVALPILAIGAFLTFRRAGRVDDDETSDAETDTPSLV